MAKKIEEEKPVKKKQTGLIIFLSILAFIVIATIFILPNVLIIGMAFLGNDNVEYENVSENKIKISKYNMIVETTDTRYDAEDMCYIMDIKVDKGETKKSLFSSTELDINYIFKDKDGYIVGENVFYISNIDKYSKWKLNNSYCDNNASEIASYEIESIFAY